MFSLLATAGTTDSSGETLTDQAVSKVNAFQRFWDGIDWDAILAAFIQKSLYLIFLIVLFWILHRVGKYLIDKSFNQYSKKAILNESRLKTLHSLLNTIFHFKRHKDIITHLYDFIKFTVNLNAYFYINFLRTNNLKTNQLFNNFIFKIIFF